jgi:hypothetical protein
LNTQDEKGAIQGTEKQKRWHLATRIWTAEEVIELSVEEVALLKNLVDKAFPSPMVVGQAWDLLDPSE